MHLLIESSLCNTCISAMEHMKHIRNVIASVGLPDLEPFDIAGTASVLGHSASTRNDVMHFEVGTGYVDRNRHQLTIGRDLLFSEPNQAYLATSKGFVTSRD